MNEDKRIEDPWKKIVKCISIKASGDAWIISKTTIGEIFNTADNFPSEP